MRQLDADIWVAEAPQRFIGLEVGSRMTVVRLPGSALFLHSPVAPRPERLREVAALGTVTYLIAPNLLHHLSVGAWADAYPEARIHAAPGLAAKRPDLVLAGTLGDRADEGWAGTIDQIRIEGLPFANEIVFFHRPSKTLIATDLAFNIGPTSPLATRLFFRATGAYGRLGPTLVERMMVKDPAAFAASLRRVLAWPFERIVVSHGDVVESEARAKLERGYAWLLDG